MNVKIRNAVIIAGWVIGTLCGCPAGYADRYDEYIEKYAEMAIAQMNEFGIPASITLAQGLLESAAGKSTLAAEGNNHFGIKCHAEWNGATMMRDDDAPDECFRVYENAAESFRDHSLFLTRKRYRSLFDLDPTDYSSWANGLKRCGYATDPNYAARLIAIIERYGLNSYDAGNLRNSEVIAEFILENLRTSHVIRKSRGLHYVIATPGDTYRSIAKEFSLDPQLLVKYNDGETADSEIKPWEEVYFQEKLESSPEGISKATIGQDESIHSVAQRFGMKESVIRTLNPKARDEAGQRLRLRK